MNNFRLIVSTQNDFIDNAKAEIWFNMLLLGDESPIIFLPGLPGIILVDTNLDPFFITKKFHEIAKRDSEFFQYVLKVIPVQRVVEADVDIITEMVKELKEIHKEELKDRKFMVRIKRRSSTIDKKKLIDIIAEEFSNEVDLKNPDWIINIEVIGAVAGISILRQSDIFSLNKIRNMQANLSN
ncbi:MAG: THUMP domain-containing protein [Promethearchaeota archaeon]